MNKNIKGTVVIRRASDDYLEHKGSKGMKWGYNKGKRNGKRTAEDDLVVDEDTRVGIKDGKAYFSQPDGKWKTADGDTYEYKDTDDLFSRKTKTTVGANLDSQTTHTVEYRGRIEQAIDKGKKWLKKLFG